MAVGAARKPRTPRQASARQRQGTTGVFVGKYERQLDPKGRLALPSEFRPRFEPRCYLAYGQDGCIEVMTPEAFEDMANDLITRQKRGELTLAELRTKASNAFAVSVDGQGRVTIDRDLRS